jgi:anti-sigma B factor antagonist
MAEDVASAQPLVLELPREIDLTNAEEVLGELAEAITAAAGPVIADLSATRFCDSYGFRILLVAHDRAVSEAKELRLVVRAGSPVSRSLALIGFDQVLRVYPELAEALAD